MREIRKKVPPAVPGLAYMDRILWIDLSTMGVSARESRHYLPQFLGGRGLAAKIAWDEYPRPVDPFDERNPLMIFPGALTGTRSPYSGRTTVCAFSPQAYPRHWLTRSNVGGWIGGDIKRAGYDGVIVSGKAEEPVRIVIADDEVAILPAADPSGKKGAGGSRDAATTGPGRVCSNSGFGA